MARFTYDEMNLCGAFWIGATAQDLKIDHIVCGAKIKNNNGIFVRIADPLTV